MTRTAALAALLALAALAGACGLDEPTARPPGSTLEATIRDRDGDGGLERAGGEPLLDRTELAPRRRVNRELVRFGQLTDTHVRDEESPARVPFLDRLGPPVTTAFRPQEALSPQVLAAAVQAMNAERPRAVLMTGDLLDSAQRNELDQFLAVMRGGQVDPGSGRRSYRGVQSASNPDGFFYRPDLDAPAHPRLLTRAQEPFFSSGLRPRWYPAIGNHDVLVQGVQPPSDATDAVATGDEALLTFDPVLEDLLEELPREAAGDGSPDLRDISPAAIDALLAGGVPGAAERVPRDARRAHLRGAEAADALRAAARLRGARPGERLDYAFELARGVRAIVLDTADRRGGSRGAVAPGQLAWLRRVLRRAGDRSIVLVDHHGLDRTEGGDEVLALLDDDPRIVAEISGDSHRTAVTPVRTSAGGFWRITTPSLSDWPQQGRMLRLVTGPGGARAIETWMVDHAGGLDARDLAGAARQLGFLDAQGGRPRGWSGARGDRNARLWLPPRRS